MSEKALHKDMPSWRTARIGEVAEVNPRSLDAEPSEDDLVSFVPMKSVEAQTGRLDPSARRRWADVRKGYTRFQEGDVLFAKITPCMENGKHALAKGLWGRRGAGSTEFHVLRPGPDIDSRFLLHFLFTPGFREAAKSRMKGTAGQLRVPKSVISDARVPVPPLETQHRIVDEIEKQLTRLDAGVAALERIQANLERYRAAVLKAACEGRLVPTEAELARREGRSYESASVLLERIKAEKAKRPSPKRRGGRRRSAEPVMPNDLPELPEGWVWSAVVDLANVTSGNTPKGISEFVAPAGDFPWFKVGSMNLPGNEHDLQVSDEWLSSEAVRDLGMRLIPEGAIVFPKRGGAIATNKKRRMGLDGCCDLNLMAVVPSARVGCYLWWWFAGLDLRRLSDGSNVPQINHKDILPLWIPLPPLSEQHRIVAEVERRLSLADDVDRILSGNLRRAARLRQSVLSAAFRGELPSCASPGAYHLAKVAEAPVDYLVGGALSPLPPGGEGQ